MALPLLLMATSGASTAAQPVAPADLAAPAPAPFVAADASAAVAALATELDANFVFPDIGKAYAAALRAKLAAGGYAAFASAEDFAAAVTTDIQAVHRDGHLKLFPPRPAAAGARPAPPSPPSGGIEKSGWIADGVAYIRFNLFPGDDATLAQLRTFMADHAAARTLIIDARGHRGGGLAEMDVMFPLLYARPETLVHMDTRVAVEQAHGPIIPDGPTLRRVAGPDGVVRRAHVVTPAAAAGPLRDAKVLLLTSRRTGSAAEHLALSLKRTGRATLIGEITGGAGHFGGLTSLGAGYSAFIPVGRTFDPATDKGWEGTGVAPDVAVPAVRALVEALVRSGVAPAQAEALSAEYSPPAASMTRPAR